MLHSDVEDMPKDRVASLTHLFDGKGCAQSLLKGEYGITAYDVFQPPASSARKKICVFGTGLGQNYGSFDIPFVRTIVQAGYMVIAYSYYGHGWSHAGPEVMGAGGCCCGAAPEYGEDILITQVSELLDHVIKDEPVIDLWVGHSTGGLVGLFVAEEVRKVITFALISPAFWAVKPFFTRVEGYTCFQRLVLNTAPGRLVVQNGVLENNDLAFGKNEDGEYLFPAEHEKDKQKIRRVFQQNSQAAKAIGALSSNILRLDQMPGYQQRLKKLLNDPERRPEKLLLVWGTKDLVVPYKYAQEVVAMNPAIVQLESPEIGHEALSEDPEGIAKIIVHNV